MSRSIFFIGQCRLDLTLNEDATMASVAPGGNMLNAAIIMGRNKLSVSMIGEAATDFPGYALTGTLATAGVNIECIDRYPDGATTVNILAPAGFEPHSRIYTNTPRERLVLKWPHISAGDIVVFGNWFALDPRTRGAVGELVEHARSRRATLVYLPGFSPQLEPAITHVMPTILDYLELADLVVTFEDDHARLFGVDDPLTAYQRSVNFYCSSMVRITSTGTTLFLDYKREPQHVPSDSLSTPQLLASMLEHLLGVDDDITPDPQSHVKHIGSWKVSL